MYIDKSIIASAADSTMRRFKGEYSYKRLSDFQQIAGELRSDMMNSAWEKAMNVCGGYYFRQPAENAEAAVAACIRAGLDKQQRLQYADNRYYLQLDNQDYYVFRELSGFTALPVPARFANFRNRLSIGFSRDVFADFLYSFDALVPDIRKATDEVLSEVRSILLERDKEDKIKMILAVARRASRDDTSATNPEDRFASFLP